MSEGGVCVCVCVLPAVHCDGVVARLLLLFLHRSNYVDHALTVSGDAHLRPAVEMELTHCSSLVLLKRWRRAKRIDSDMFYRYSIIPKTIVGTYN